MALEAESTARNAVDEVRNQQNYFLGKFESIPKNIPVISPAFRWAQSLNHIYLETKYSTRFDSPACLDIFDQEFKILGEGTRLYHSAMCRNDKKLLKYELNLDLYNMVLPETDGESFYEDQSVGRILITLAKFEQPSRWRRLLADDSKKPQNMGVQWELWEKYDKELENYQPIDELEDTPEEGEEAEKQDEAEEEEKEKPKKKKGGKKGKKKAGKYRILPHTFNTSYKHSCHLYRESKTKSRSERGALIKSPSLGPTTSVAFLTFEL